MTPHLPNPRLPHHLLIAVSRAHLDGSPPPDWQECAAAAAVTARPGTVNRALSHLANQGLIEGVLSADGWLALRPTTRGLARAGRAARTPPDARPAADGARPAAPIRPSASERVAATKQELAAEVETLTRYAGAGWRRLAEATTPRLTAMRTTMVDAWHMFTTFP